MTSTPPTSQSSVGSVADTPTSADAARLWIAIIAHLVIDAISFIVVPLMSVLKGHAHMSDGQGAVLLGVGALSSGLVQPIVAVLSDRHDTRAVGTLGLIVAAACVGSVGFVHTFWMLLPLQVLAAAGIGAFHPVAAAAVGQLASTRPGGRTRGVAIFFAAGMLGGILGNVTAPSYVRWAGGGHAEEGLPALAFLLVPGLIFAGLLAWAIHGVPHRHHSAAADHAALDPAERRARWRSVVLLYLGNVLRYFVDMMLIQLIIPLTERKALLAAHASTLDETLRANASQMSGPLQASKQLGMGLGGLCIGFLVARRHERALLIWVPIVGAVFLASMPHTGDWVRLNQTGGLLALLMCCLAGAGYAGVIPTTISLSQRLLPHRTSLASGLMMGGAWAIAAAGPSMAQGLLSAVGLSWTFGITALMLAVSGLLGIGLRALD